MGEHIAAQDAYERLRQNGELSSVTVMDTFDFAAFDNLVAGTAPPLGYRLSAVEFLGPVRLVGLKLSYDVRIEGSRFADKVHLQQCTLGTFAVRSSVWLDDLAVEDCIFRKHSPFDDNEFQSDVKFHLVEFLRRPSFRNGIFRGRTEFLECHFGVDDLPTKTASFANAVFEGPALFNKSTFHTGAKFQSALFEKDVSFIGTRLGPSAVFRNVHFKGDAEFRFCRIEAADFGNRDNLTLFTARADFRGCEIGGALFDYVEFRGETSFVDVRFGSGGASFRYANLGSTLADFEGVSSDGPLIFANARVPALRFYWSEIRSAVLAANPDAKVLSTLYRRLEALGQTEGALEAGYYLARRKFAESMAEPLPALSQEPSAFLDGVGRRLIASGEWLLWGWPTGYGTKLGRILLLAVACWLIAAVPVAAAKRLLIRVPPAAAAESDDKPGGGAASHQPLALSDLPENSHFPESFTSRLGLALRLTFRVLFKIGPENVRYVTLTPSGRGISWKTYFVALWYLGSGLLVLITLTLANTSPLIDRLIGELFP